MRLTPHEREVIRRLGLHHFGKTPRLFGSRLDDARRGGDVDLLVATDLPPGQAARRRLDLLTDLWLELGEGEWRSAELHRQMAAEAAARANPPRRSRRFFGSADLYSTPVPCAESVAHSG